MMEAAANALMHKIFDGDEIGAVGLASQHNAGIDRIIDEAIADSAAQHHRASPAIPLGATFLRSGSAFMKTKIVQKREVRCGAAQANNRAATHELNMATHPRLYPSMPNI